MKNIGVSGQFGQNKNGDSWHWGKLENLPKVLRAVPFEEIKVQNRAFYPYRRDELIGRRFRRRMRLRVFPKIAVTKNFLYNLFFLDEVSS
jgi:hypothetical protein